MKPDPLAQPDERPRTQASARLAADVEAYLARGGQITTCPAGVAREPEIATRALDPVVVTAFLVVVMTVFVLGKHAFS